MTNEELIAVARSHITDMPELSGNNWATAETFPKASVMDAVIVTFESDQRPGHILVVLEKQTGKFILSGMHPQ